MSSNEKIAAHFLKFGTSPTSFLTVSDSTNLFINYFILSILPVSLKETYFLCPGLKALNASVSCFLALAPEGTFCLSSLTRFFRAFSSAPVNFL